MCTCTAGDAVIVTASLGVLKRGGIQFSPALPERKLGAIKRLGFGVLNKVKLLVHPTSAATNAVLQMCMQFSSTNALRLCETWLASAVMLVRFCSG